MKLSYVLPLLRRPGEGGLDELTDYLNWLSRRVEVIVADGSSPELQKLHESLWPDVVHVAVTNRPRRYGKVTGVHAGMERATHETVIIADDDVRYSERSLRQIRRAMEFADLVRPQNYFAPLPWHAAWDTSRILLNRAFGSDSPGTLAVRRCFFWEMGGYSEEAMYDNLELIRTVAAHRGRVSDRPDIYVHRFPSTTRRFWEQRPRQAYDDFAQPGKLVGFLALLPGLALSRGLSRRRVVAAASITVALAEWGRRRHEGRRYFPSRTSWFAPLWVLERGICSWLALFYRFTGGVPYAGTRFRVAAHSMRKLRRSAATKPVAPVTQRSLAGAAATTQGDN